MKVKDTMGDFTFLQRVRIACNADRCNSQNNSVCLSVHPSEKSFIWDLRNRSAVWRMILCAI